MILDFRRTFEKVGFDFNPEDGLVARHFPKVFRHYRNWAIGVLQGSRDVAMSQLFGNISPGDHQELVYGPGGLVEACADPSDNAASWVNKTYMHTFLKMTFSSHMIAADKDAYAFVSDLIDSSNSGHAGPSFND